MSWDCGTLYRSMLASQWQRNRIRYFLRIVLAIMFPATLLSQVPDPEPLKQGIVHIEADKGVKELGTGIVFSVTPERIRILTALHVVKGAKSIHVAFYSDKLTLLPAQKMPRQSDDLDLAVLEVRAAPGVILPQKVPHFNFGPERPLHSGEQVFTVNAEWVVIPNSIARLDHGEDGEDTRMFEYTPNSVGNGFSGGPVFDDMGYIIGMHDKLTGLKDYAVAINIQSTIEMLKALGYDVPAGPSNDGVTGNSGKPLKMGTLQINGTFQPEGAPSSQTVITITPNAGNKTYTASLLGMMTFVGGASSDGGKTFVFPSVQSGGHYLQGTTLFSISAGLLTVKLGEGTASGGSYLQGGITGQMTVEGSGLGRGLFGRNSIKLSGELSGTYTESMVADVK